MILIVVATKVEAFMLIKYLNLQKESGDKFTIFKNIDIVLIISGVGKYNALVATTYILSTYKIDMLYNIGIAGSANGDKIGSIFAINKITDKELQKDFYPDILLKLPIKQCDIETHNVVVDKKIDISSRLVDMESSGIFFAGIRFLSPNSMLFLKVVSDNLKPDIPDKNFVYKLFEQNIQIMCDIIKNYRFKKDNIYDMSILKTISTKLKLTKAQELKLDKNIKYYILNGGNQDKIQYLVSIPKQIDKNRSKQIFLKLQYELLKN